MAASKSRAGTPRKKATAKKKSAKKKVGGVTVSRSKITFSLTPREVAKAKQCLEKTGTIRIGFKELRVTRLPMTLDDGKVID